MSRGRQQELAAMKTTYFARSTPQALALVVALFASIAPGPLFAGPTAPPEAAIAPEKNPPGDIPDDQVFITFKEGLIDANHDINNEGTRSFLRSFLEGFARIAGKLAA